jgi:hypothetical protein
MTLRRAALLSLPMFLVFAASCSTAPQRAQDTLSVSQAKEWLARYCFKGPRELSGSLVFQANTPEFKGQHPGSVRMERTGAFVLEATHILGGTLLRIHSDGKTFDLVAPSKPKVNRSGITRYLGLDVPILQGLLAGDLPCPSDWRSAEVEVEGAEIRILSRPWIWSFTRAMSAGSEKPVDQVDRVPFGIDLTPVEPAKSRGRIELRIETWDRSKNLAKKVRIHSEEGDLKWTWRNRD